MSGRIPRPGVEHSSFLPVLQCRASPRVIILRPDPEEQMSTHEHKREAPAVVGCFVLTVSDTRTVETDKSGKAMVEYLEQAGQQVVGHAIVKDEPGEIRETVSHQIDDPDTDVVLITGGTGLGSRDRTPETLAPLLEKQMPGYGELFRMLSYAEIGAAAMLSRALAGVARQTVIIVTPGSTGAVRLAMEKLIIPELGHLVREATR